MPLYHKLYVVYYVHNFCRHFENQTLLESNLVEIIIKTVTTNLTKLSLWIPGTIFCDNIYSVIVL
jgi:hypothetical protein